MKINYISIVAGIIAFVSLALPWWTMAISGTVPVEFMEVEVSGDISVKLYDARMSIEAEVLGVSVSVDESMVDGFSIWYGYVALALIVIAGVAGIVGSLIVGKNGKMILVVAGILALLSIIIFAAGLQGELSDEIEPGYPELSLFSSGSFSESIPEMGLVELDYSTYLTFGFWLALIAAILAFISLLKHPVAPPPAPPAAPPTTES